MLSLVSVLTPNETEAALLTGGKFPIPEMAAVGLQAQGAENVVITLGVEGVLLMTRHEQKRIPARQVEQVVDTTAAGDCFTGALAVALGEGQSLEMAAAFANAAASLSVERAGAQPSLPNRYETDLRLNVG